MTKSCSTVPFAWHKVNKSRLREVYAEGPLVLALALVRIHMVTLPFKK